MIKTTAICTEVYTVNNVPNSAGFVVFRVDSTKTPDIILSVDELTMYANEVDGYRVGTSYALTLTEEVDS